MTELFQELLVRVMRHIPCNTHTYAHAHRIEVKVKEGLERGGVREIVRQRDPLRVE